MIHDIELGAGDFALVEIGIVVVVTQFFELRSRKESLVEQQLAAVDSRA